MSDGPTILEYVNERFKHLEQLFTLGQESAKRAVDKAEIAQTAHNVAQNEWRQTLTDFRQNVPSRQEFERLLNDLNSYKLEVSRILAAMAATKEAGRAGTDDIKTWIAIAIAALAIVVAYFKHG